MIPFALAIVSGLVLSLGFPGINFQPAVWLWLYPLLGALWLRDLTKKRAFSIGLVAGLSFGFVNLSWVRHSSRVINGATGNEWMGIGVEAMGWSAVLGLSLFVAAHIGVWAVLASRIGRPGKAVVLHGNWLDNSLDSLRSAALTACAWVAMEWVRSWMFTGFGWNGLGVALHRNAVLIQIADSVGVAGVAFLPVFASCVLFNVVRRYVLRARSGRAFLYHFDALVVAILLAGQAVYGLVKLGASEGPTVPVRTALVQLNVPQIDIFTRDHLAERYQRYAEFTKLFGQQSDLVVWPESALGLPFEHPDHERFFDDLLGSASFALLAGCDVGDVESPPAYTSAALFQGGYKNAQLHHKVHLVPFGEYVPLRHTIPFLNATVGQIIQADFTPGPRTEPLQLARPGVGIIPLICFEDTDGALARKFLREGQPQLLVNVTNDGWFLQSSEPEQHLANALFRAIELRRPLCRACNTGVTGFIDDRGRLLSSLRDPDTHSTFMEGVLPATVAVPQHPPVTLYARFGDWFARLCAIVCVVVLILRSRETAQATR